MWSNLFANLTVVGSIHAIPPTATGVTPGSNVFVFSNVSGQSMIMNSSGRIGIGTANPTTELDVNGSIQAVRYYGDGGTLSNLISFVGATGPAPSGNPGDLVYLISSGVAGATANVSYTGDGNFYVGGLATLANLYVPGNANIEYLSVSNLAVTGNLIITATNVETTNALTINNSGTMTALKVTQNETSIHTHNVAEFWDATTLAMVIDPEGNVAIHTTSSPGYALTVTDPANFETLYIRGKTGQTNLNVNGNVYVSNAVTTTNVYVADTLQVASTFLANSTAVDMGFNSLSITYVNTSNLITSNIIASTGNVNVYGNVVSSGFYYGDAGLLSNVSSRAIVQPFANLVVSNSVTTTNVFATQYTGSLSGYNQYFTRNLGNPATSFYVLLKNTGTSGSVIGRIFGRRFNSAVRTGNISEVVVEMTTGGLANYSLRATSSNTQQTSELVSVVYNTATYIALYVYTGSLSDYASIFFEGYETTPNNDILLTTSVTSSNPLPTSQSNYYILNSAVGIGTNNPNATLEVTGNIYASNAVTTTNVFATRLNLTTALAVTSGGTGTTTSTGTGSVVLSNAPTLTGTTNIATLIASGNITSLSDRRIKKDIKRIEGALDKVIQIGGYTFTRTDESNKDQRQAGIIAQEILKVLPEVVQISEETGYYSVSYGNITALLIEALKEERVERLKLEERLACLENQSKATQ